jgi:predicted enzyme related to lactoylglutathione lyase
MSRIAAISIYVDNLNTARAFYEDALGFSVTASHPGILELEHGQTALVLCEGPKRTAREYPTGVVLGVPVKDLGKCLAQLREKRMPLVHDEPEPFPRGRFAACIDPAGNAIELLEFNAQAARGEP